MAKKYRFPLHVVLYQEEGVWLAHALELDLIGDGENRSAAVECLMNAVMTQVDACLKYQAMPSNLFSPADGEVFAKYAAGRNLGQGELNLTFEGDDVEATIRIESVFAREYVDADLVPA